ncbi:Flp pilus assembly protein TadG [Sinomonas atrocyanea]|uniref:pilus assembly protein TadG-related protein n=1 Tax=Sinomonas atrocyanea TaxID=37927 RepID=UPI002781F582|nr:pilus assembly protein TadG-related protein [Sinomonas atrocyanea]MDP9884832.1 Flp pilus assembly protein TadG [Sinomonas atrocyanea]
MRRLISRLFPPASEREKGATIAFVAVLLVVLLGAGAVAVDFGQLAAERAQLQNGADAAALAVADSCAKSPSTCASGSGDLGTTYGNANANDGATTIGPPAIDFTAGTVTANASTLTNDGSPSMILSFARFLGINTGSARATATASWGYPTRGKSILPLAMNVCEFNLNSSAATPVMQKILTQGGGGTPDCNGRTPSNQIMPGGFAWLMPTGPGACELTVGVGDWAQTSTGASAPHGCINAVFQPSLLGTNVAVPIYDDFRGTGNNTYYHVSKWAGFHILGWSFPSTQQGTWPAPTNNNGIYGYFLGFSADPSVFSGFQTSPTPQPGAMYLTKLIG